MILGIPCDDRIFGTSHAEVSNVYGSVEKVRQRRSRRLVVLTYSSVRSARPNSCGLAGRAFLNTPLFFLARGPVTHIVMERQYGASGFSVGNPVPLSFCLKRVSCDSSPL